MKVKILYLIFSFLFLIASLLSIFHYHYFNFIQSPILIPIIIFLVLFGVTIVFLSKDEKNARYFSYILFLISIYLVSSLLPFPSLDVFSSIIISFLPYFVYNFFIIFNFFPSSSLQKKIKKFLFVYSITTSILFLIAPEHFYQLILLNIILSILGCAVLYHKEKDHLSTKTRKEDTLLTTSLIISLSPFILSYSVLNNILSTRLKMYAISFVLLIPITVGIILLRRNDIHINKTVLTVNFITHFIYIFLLFVINSYILHLSQRSIYLTTILYFFVLYIFHLKNLFLNSIELKKVQHIKNEFQKEKLDLIQKITKEQILASISSLVTKLLMQNYRIENYLVIWKDLYNPYILSSSGELSNVTLSNKIINELEKESKVFHYQNNKFVKFRFYKNNQIFGWLIVNKYGDSSLTTEEYKSINDLSCIIGEIIIETERLYDIKQETFKIESLSYDEYVNYEYLNMVQNFHKDFSFFIHDNVLQNILALKKMTESINTNHTETKKLMLETFDSLNRTFRDKMFELYPSTIEKAPLSQSIQLLCDKFNHEQDSIYIKFYSPKKKHLKKEIKFHIYRIVQELLTNAIKHSQASKVFISIIQSEFFIECIVQDDGIGFDHSKIKLKGFENKHLGILSITQEVNSLNGEIKISAIKPQGTKFTITLPTVKEI